MAGEVRRPPGLGRNRRLPRHSRLGARGQNCGLQLHTFDEVADALHGMIPGDLGPWHCYAHRYGIKVWFGERQPANKEHYEAQVVGARHVEGAEVLAVEIGFHAEHRKEEDNEAAIALLMKGERKWRKALGKEPVAAASSGTPTTGVASPRLGTTPTSRTLERRSSSPAGSSTSWSRSNR